MVAPIAGWRSLSSHNLPTNPVAEVCVECFTDLNPAGEGGIQDVTFAIAQVGNPGYSANVVVSTRTFRSPNHNHPSVSSPIVGAPAGRMAWFDGYGFDMNLLTYPAGTLRITATVRSVAGSTYTLPDDLWIHNDTDGVDRRPSKKDVHVNGQTGNDSTGDGTELRPFRSINRGVYECRSNTAGSSSSDRDAGGARVHVHGAGVMEWAASGVTTAPWHTSNGWWLEVIFDSGVIVDRTEGFPPLVATGNGAGTECNLRLVRPYFRGKGAYLYSGTGVTTRVWVDGMLQTSRHSNVANPSLGKRHSVRFLEDAGEAVFIDNANSGCRRLATNSRLAGVANGLSGFQLQHDCSIENFLGVAFQLNPDFGIPQLCNCVVDGARDYAGVAGRVDAYIPGAAITALSGNRMKIQATAPVFFSQYGLPATSVPCDLLTLQEIVGSSFFFLYVSGSGIAQNDSPGSDSTPYGQGPVGNQVLEVGTDIGTGYPYVVLQFAAPVTAQTAPTTMRLRTCRSVAVGAPVGDLWHGDIVYFQNNQDGTIVSHLSARDINSGQTYFSSSSNLVRCAMVNCTDGTNNTDLTANFFGGSSRAHSIFIGNTITRWRWNPAHDATGMNVVNNVMQFNDPLPAGGSGPSLVSHNHFVDPTNASGASATTGTWFDAAATNYHANPWNPKPLDSLLDTGSSLYPTLAAWRWPGSVGTTRGANYAIGTFDRSVPVSGGVDGVLELPVQIPLAAFGAPAALTVAEMPVAVPLAATGLVGALVTAAMPIDVPMAIVGSPASLSSVDWPIAIPFAAVGAPEAFASIELPILAPTHLVTLVGALAAAEMPVPVPMAMVAELVPTSGISGSVEMPMPLPMRVTAAPDAVATVSLPIWVPLGAVALVGEIPEPYFPGGAQSPGELRRWGIGEDDFWR